MKRFIVLIVFLLFIPLAFADSIAILPFDASAGVDEETVAAITEFVQYSFAQNYPDYKILARTQIRKILNEQNFQLTGITESAVEAGKILGVNFVLTGNLMKLGSKYTIIINYIDVETGEILYNKKKSSKSDIEYLDINLVEPAVKTLFLSDKTEKDIKERTYNRNKPEGFYLKIKRGIRIFSDDSFTKCDPWIEVWLGKDYIGRTDYYTDNPSPKINKSFFIPKPNRHQYIKLLIYDHDPFQEQLIGSITLNENTCNDLVSDWWDRGYYIPKTGQYHILAKYNGELVSLGIVEIEITR